MRRILILALFAVAAWAIVTPHMKTSAASIPAFSALHSVQRLMTCDAGALAQISTSPGSVSNSCSASAGALTGATSAP